MNPQVKDFWLSCGHHLTDRDVGGGLLVTPDYLRAYLARPELLPPGQACTAERALHMALLADPLKPISFREIAAISDVDARENWQLMMRFRDHLLQHKTLEAAYLDFIRKGVGDTPPLFLHQLVHVILRNILDSCRDPFVLRAAELLFRPQRIALHDGAVIAADEEKIAGLLAPHQSPLLTMLGTPSGESIEILTEENAETYWHRSDLFDIALDLSPNQRGVAALATVLELWLRHMLCLDVQIEPLHEMCDVRLTWYVGLDAEGTRIGNALWNGEDVDKEARGRIIALFRLTFRNDETNFEVAEGHEIYLILALTSDQILRVKPQNLLGGLPIRHKEALS
jgi:Family of unknown function (DUF6352)